MLTVLRKVLLLVLALTFLLPSPVRADVIDPTRTGTLVLQFAHPNVFDDEPGPSAMGVGVRIQRLTSADLTTYEGWRSATALRATDLLQFDDSAFDVNRSGYSDAAGTVAFTDLTLGLYRVTPLDESSFNPFAVTIPSSARDNLWDYTIHVYPKVSGRPSGPGEPGDGNEHPVPGSPPITPSPTSPPGSDPPEPGSQPADTTSDRETPGTSRDSVLGGLASTGASVLGFVVSGLLLLFSGFYLILRKRKGTTDEEI